MGGGSRGHGVRASPDERGLSTDQAAVDPQCGVGVKHLHGSTQVTVA
jgi:hypothetical protein